MYTRIRHPERDCRGDNPRDIQRGYPVSPVEVAETVSKAPEIAGYTADHVPFARLLLDEIKKAETKMMADNRSNTEMCR